MTKEQIKGEFLRDECDLMQAIEMLQDNCLLSPREAEELVYEWEDEKKPSETGNKRYPREEDDEDNDEGA
jgi:hypothetical protein